MSDHDIDATVETLARVITITSDQVTGEWHALFDARPHLEGLGSGRCGDVFCCPDADDVDWEGLEIASHLLFLGTGATSARTLTRTLVTGDPA